MDLIIWRHAEAEPGEPDEARALTTKGHKQASKTAGWLDRHLPGNCRILVSPAVRTVQTAEALGRKFKTHPALAHHATAQGILAAVNWPDARETVLVVGHQPTLGHVISLLITGQEQEWMLRKGSVCWIAQKVTESGAVNYLKAVIGAELAGK
ncbi:SixA phosphatase family protein [Noviherbaspirillum sp.]|uniref:SixA phosphatase family protein n=1 Tax=Noviherbaspirillum sp. TaxID=1926288 RepID=UPI002FE069C4